MIILISVIVRVMNSFSSSIEMLDNYYDIHLVKETVHQIPGLQFNRWSFTLCIIQLIVVYS